LFENSPVRANRTAAEGQNFAILVFSAGHKPSFTVILGNLKAFHCESCGSLVFFENVRCLTCGHVLGFLPVPGELAALEPTESGAWRALASRQTSRLYRFCRNGQQYEVCNWMVAAEDTDLFCLSCRLNTLIPNLSLHDNWECWHKLEIAKRRIIYTIMRLGLPMHGVPEENRPALRFSFIGDSAAGPTSLTGHLNGLIVINIAEADDPERERRRVSLHEPYRTLLGHLRHEVAHYYWDRLIADSSWLPGFRNLFGDETADYGTALRQHYQNGSPSDWQSRHVSAYASAHPWEDWAETWAHYFHIMDMMETAYGFGITLAPKHPAAESMTASPKDAFDINVGFDEILENWFPLTYALNAINRGMGLHDVYPFVLSGQAIERLRFIHEVVKNNRADQVIQPA
jgi:hypothetical protein